MGGGLNIAEITLTVPNAITIIKELTMRYGTDLLVGAGTVLNTRGCEEALAAGAEFIVSPTLNAEVVKLARHHDKLCMPGALTPFEVLAAWDAGPDFVKVFPVNSVGGPSYIRSLKGPFPHIEFVVTGNVTMENAPQFLAAGVTAVGVGESIISRQALESKDVNGISANAKRFLECVRGTQATK